MIIEPCCISNQLPALLKESPDTIFYSNGDWGVEKLMYSVDCMVDSPSVEILLCPSIDVSLCRYLRKSLQKKWIKGIFVCTTEDCTELFSGELGKYNDKALYIHRSNLEAQLYVRYNADQMIAISGPMLLHGTAEHGKFCMYHGVFGKHGRKFNELMAGVVPLFATKIRDHSVSEVKRNLIERRYE